MESREESGRLERARESDKVGEGHGCSTEVNTVIFSVLWEVICIFAFVICDPVIQFLLQDFHENQRTLEYFMFYVGEVCERERSTLGDEGFAEIL